MRRGLVALLLVLAACTDEAPSADPGFEDRDCVDFATQAKAQRFFERQGGPDTDPHLLDPDHDGIACETRPCPCVRPGDEPDPTQGTSREAEVVYVADGDTIGVRRGTGAPFAVRLLGIDAPETTRPRECGSRASEANLAALLPRGTRVTLTDDPTQDDTDKFDRRLRYVSLDGVDLGLTQVREGYAAVYAYARPPFGRFDLYHRAERRAEGAGRGNWARCGAPDG